MFRLFVEFLFLGVRVWGSGKAKAQPEWSLTAVLRFQAESILV